MKQTNSQPRWFFWFFAGYTALTLGTLVALYVDFFLHPIAPDIEAGSPVYRLFIALGLVPAGIVISALVLRRAPRNVTGLFLLMYCTAIMLGTMRLDSPLQVWSGILNSSWLGLWLLPLYFPDGDAYPPRFRRWIRLHAIITAVLFIVVTFFTPQTEIVLPSGAIDYVHNPVYIPALNSIAGPVTAVQIAMWISSVLMIIPSIILRFRASYGLVRQQIKWFVWVFTINISIYILVVFVLTNIIGPEQFEIPKPVINLYGLSFTAAPLLVVGYTILRHKLYDIDIIIRRTLIYSVITLVLAVVYFGGVALIQSAFVAITGQESPLAVVASTLAIAALFTPVRRRVQDVVDRRFFRRKYDAEKTVDAFARAVRDEVDMDRLRGTLLGVVEETMQPEHVSLWVRSR